MMISYKSKFAPQKFIGNIKSIPLTSIIDFISFTCILYVTNDKNTGAIYFKNGDLVGARLNNEFNIHKAEDILSWSEGSYSYKRWINNFEIDVKQIQDVLYLIEICNLNAKIYLFKNDDITDIRCSEGKIVSVNPKPKNLEEYFSKIRNYKEGKINIKLNKGQTGDLNLHYSDIIHNNTKSNKTNSKPEKKAAIKQAKRNGKEIHTKAPGKLRTDVIVSSFNNLKKVLRNTLVAGSLYTSSLGKPIYSFNSEAKQSVLFAKLFKNINRLLIESKFEKFNEYYMLDLKEDYLVFVLIFKEHHFGMVFRKSEIKLGYFLNILKPILINDYLEAIS